MSPVDQSPAEADTPVELITNSDPKPGLKSTEFWMIAAANLIAVALVLLDKLEAEWAATAVTILTALYTVLRNQLKVATVKEASKLFTWLLIGTLTFAGLSSCNQVTTRTISPDGTIHEIITKSPDRGTIGTLARTAAAIAGARAAAPVDRSSGK